MRTTLLAGSLVVLFGVGLVACGDDDGGNNVNNQNNNNSAATCGDGVAAGTETCDGADLRANNCASLGQGFTGGTLACNAFCDGWNTTACTSDAQCGDSTVEGNEICDLANLDGNDCTTIGQGFASGTLACNADCLSWDTSLCVAATCGDDTAEGNELCDGVDLDSNDCTTIGQGFISGTLACNGTCDGWDTTGCTLPTCGDSLVEGNEICDLANLNSNDCTTIPGGYTGGTLACGVDCLTWDTSSCTGGPVCGDGTADVGEDCDTADLNSNDCTTVPGSYTGGTLACNANCTFDVSQCTGGTGVCGDGNIDAGEDCDGANLGTDDCTTVPGSYTGGTLSCSSSCTFNVSQCTGGTSVCGNNTVEGGELCDGTDHNGEDCTTVGVFSGGTLGCNANCLIWDVSQCTYNPSCGNGLAEGIEQCDGADLQGAACTDAGFTGGTLSCTAGCLLDWSACTSGVPGWTCNPTWYGDGGCDCGCGIVDTDCADATVGSCAFCGEAGSCNGLGNDCPGIIDPVDNSQCTAATCGNSTAEGTEQCDGADLRGAACTDLGFGGGTLACDASCGFDLSGCTAAVCGNNTVEGFEFCDGADLNGNDCTSLGLGFAGGTLACDGTCNFDTSQCTMPVCGDGVADPGEQCDGADLGGATGMACVDLGWTAGAIGCTSACEWDFSACTGGVAGWTCFPDYYGTADGCDCGCGIVDPDCADGTVGSCEFCNDIGSCNVATCPGTISSTDNSQCI